MSNHQPVEAKSHGETKIVCSCGDHNCASLDVEPDCNCYSLYEDGETGKVIHYAECDVIKYRLGY
jgi:hypothetical protein